nr:rod shape-determining protein MreC [Dissulfurirhabdus thermomarina]
MKPPSAPLSKRVRRHPVGCLALAAALGLVFLFVGFRLGRPGFRPATHGVMEVGGLFQKALSVPAGWLGDLWRSYVDLRDVRVENAALRSEIERLREEVNRYREAMIANVRLQRLLDLRGSLEAPTLAARVVAVDVAPWVATVTVDRGASQGVAPGMAVLAGAGVAGQVVDTAPHFSRVLLLTDYNSAADAFVQRSRARGVLKGTGEVGLCRLEYVEKGADVQVGDVVVTSGLDQIYPKGLLLGRVTAVEPGTAEDLFQEVTVRPAADFRHLEEVLIVLRTGGGVD